MPVTFNSIADLHRVLGLPKPMHPLIAVVDNTQIAMDSTQFLSTPFLLNFYKISFKTGLRGKIRYGQGYYDFDDGGMVFTAPNQLLAVTDDTEYKGLTLLIHPDYIRSYPLGTNIRNYGFFSYAANEALHLSDKEKSIILTIINNIDQELHSNIDDFSQDVIISQLELLLNYSNRFYKRQFLTRKAVNNDLLANMENILNKHFHTDDALQKGLPTVQYLATQLNISPHYLSDMLRSLTGQNAQQHIQNKVIERAKEILSTGNQSVAEIAYQLGFEYPQSFNKLFKKKTDLSPLEYRQSFN